MSLDRSLKSSGGLDRHRNVLTRSERVAKLADKGKFDLVASSPLGLPKVANRKVSAGAKAAPKKDAAAAAAPGAAGAAAAPAAGAAAGKAPAAGAKAAAPAGDKKAKK